LTAQVFVGCAHGGLQTQVGIGSAEANANEADGGQFDLVEFEHGELQ
jgi:hypothetical protein